MHSKSTVSASLLRFGGRRFSPSHHQRCLALLPLLPAPAPFTLSVPALLACERSIQDAHMSFVIHSATTVRISSPLVDQRLIVLRLRSG